MTLTTLSTSPSSPSPSPSPSPPQQTNTDTPAASSIFRPLSTAAYTALASNQPTDVPSNSTSAIMDLAHSSSSGAIPCFTHADVDLDSLAEDQPHVPLTSSSHHHIDDSALHDFVPDNPHPAAFTTLHMNGPAVYDLNKHDRSFGRLPSVRQPYHQQPQPQQPQQPQQHVEIEHDHRLDGIYNELDDIGDWIASTAPKPGTDLTKQLARASQATNSINTTSVSSAKTTTKTIPNRQQTSTARVATAALHLHQRSDDRRRDNMARDKVDRATVEQVLDPRTRMILFRLLSRNRLRTLDGCVSTGKEANVYYATASSMPNSMSDINGIYPPNPGLNVADDTPDAPVAVKVFKTSILQFKDRERYVAGEFRFRRTGYQRGSNRKMVQQWAEKEFRNQMRLHEAGIPAPIPLLLKPPVLIMSFFGKDGWPAPRLKDAALSPSRLSKTYSTVCGLMRRMFQVAHLVHGDLSEYNMLYWNGSVVIIDVSQSVEDDHPMALDFLRRDCANVNDFFRRSGVPCVLSVRELFEFVTVDHVAEKFANIEEEENIDEDDVNNNNNNNNDNRLLDGVVDDNNNNVNILKNKKKHNLIPSNSTDEALSILLDRAATRTTQEVLAASQDDEVFMRSYIPRSLQEVEIRESHLYTKPGTEPTPAVSEEVDSSLFTRLTGLSLSQKRERASSSTTSGSGSGSMSNRSNSINGGSNIGSGLGGGAVLSRSPTSSTTTVPAAAAVATRTTTTTTTTLVVDDVHESNGVSTAMLMPSQQHHRHHHEEQKSQQGKQGEQQHVGDGTEREFGPSASGTTMTTTSTTTASGDGHLGWMVAEPVATSKHPISSSLLSKESPTVASASTSTIPTALAPSLPMGTSSSCTSNSSSRRTADDRPNMDIGAVRKTGLMEGLGEEWAYDMDEFDEEVEEELVDEEGVMRQIGRIDLEAMTKISNKKDVNDNDDRSNRDENNVTVGVNNGDNDDDDTFDVNAESDSSEDEWQQQQRVAQTQDRYMGMTPKEWKKKVKAENRQRREHKVPKHVKKRKETLAKRRRGTK